MDNLLFKHSVLQNDTQRNRGILESVLVQKKIFDKM